ncbi:MAG: hypothetical protein KC550_00195 [Nanoarchaeota archaeon]|nr:hypothetical protein [Nanoarchaeota archaeon]
MNRLRLITAVNNNMKHINMGEWDIVDTNSDRKILFTYGLATCTGIIGINKKSKVCFLGHFAPRQSISKNLLFVQKFLKRFYGDFDEKFEIYYTGGINENEVKKAILSNEELREIFNSEVERIRVLEGIGINCETLEIFEYSRFGNMNDISIKKK